MNDLVGKIVFGDKDATEDLRFKNQLMLCKQNEALTDNVKQLVSALEDMVFQFAYRNKEGLLITAGISALEIAFDVLGIEEGTDPETLDGTKFHPDTRKALENALNMRDREIEKLKTKLDAIYDILEEYRNES